MAALTGRPQSPPRRRRGEIGPATCKCECGVMRNIVITAAILAGLGLFMADMANKLTPASASTSSNVAAQVAISAPKADAGLRRLNIPRDARGHFATDGRIDG